MINQRIFSANVGDNSIGQSGPDAIETDIDNLLANDQELLGITGDKTTLTTDTKVSLVTAINEHETQINDLDTEVDTHKTDTLAHIQALDSRYQKIKVNAPNSDLNDIIETGIYSMGSTIYNGPGVGGSGSMVIAAVFNEGSQEQIWMGRAIDCIYYRRKNVGTWTPWVELHHSGNQPKVTVSTTQPSNPKQNDVWIEV